MEGPYLWKTKDGDQPINVIGSLGFIGDREYVRIEGSLTGIPFDECIPMKKSRPCVRCKEMIPAERVEALPETKVCVKCSQAIGGEFVFTAVEENIGKVGSLKKNYGGISIKKTRKRIEPLEEE